MDSRLEEASAPRHYIQLVVVIVIGLVGIYLRYADFRYSSLVADAILLIAAFLMFRIVFRIMK